MNNKGFAISVILYSIIFLVITIMFMLLGIVKTRYTVNEKLRESIIFEIDDLNNYSNESNYACTITASSNNYDPNLVLTINVDSDMVELYSFDGENYVSSNETVANHSGTYVGYFMDSNGDIGSCSVELTSSTVYRYQDCSNVNKIFGNWYDGTVTYANSCSPYSRAKAENDYNTWYRDCKSAGSSQLYFFNGEYYQYAVEPHYRNITGCNWNNETNLWSSWITDSVNSNNIKRVESEIGYKIRDN